MNIFITGATGFIGRHVCALLTAQGHEVVALMRRPQELDLLRQRIAALGGDSRRLSCLAGDLGQPGLGIAEVVPALDVVVHLGARFAWKLDVPTARRVNVEGSLSVAELARAQGARLVFASGFMLENREHLEALGINPNVADGVNWPRVYRRVGAYEASKLEAALKTRAFALEKDVDGVEVQPATVAGHSRTGELDRSQPLYQLIDNLASGRLAMVPGTPSHWLPLVAVDVLAKLIAVAATASPVPRQILALDAATPSLADLLTLVADELGRKPPRRHIPLPMLSALLKVPGLPALMNTEPEALHFIQTSRFDTRATERFLTAQGIVMPPIETVVRATAQAYRDKTEVAVP
ncbi:NAD-dependent dehydratase [Alkalilimnicola ehrlichii]|uniref:NAD-dependent dehydratase n=1 Tax=Alkalilimnicola ehrlichii TaxID=351052 RepID=A0A3E0X1M4_9GAMM|nr:SDR family oxidoreductase [Alkalilimnicola ehrlichii]RFA30800.1 NAD-dependent dehydratase [Alkalilimnicola ehrlichii]RFA38377.1 NAD-dependent dehydratase [Alkalilimnicola ehrlichii]